VARRLDITPGAARVRVHRGLASLRASLDARRDPVVAPVIDRTAINSRESTR
jgi:hypothetical protein